MTGTPDMRTLMQAYVAGANRPTRHVDICLDPACARTWKDADTELTDAKAASDDATDETGSTIGSAAAAKKRLAAATKAEKDARDRLAQSSIRLVFTGLTTTAWNDLVNELRRIDDEEQRATIEQVKLPRACLTKATTIDGADTGIDGDDLNHLLDNLPPADVSRCWAAALEACTETIDLPF
ncbi:MAG: hypothetical protein E6128_01645 [Cutibacterium avidum]|nr:hypothetical protein [Cutibacterium avidum]MDU5418794.1 hypothetical protein [Cutibacterium avidum]